jgi:cell division protein FtsL
MVGVVELVAGAISLLLINRAYVAYTLKKEVSKLNTKVLVTEDEVARKEKVIKDLKSELKDVYAQIETFKTEVCDKECVCEPDTEVVATPKSKSKKSK